MLTTQAALWMGIDVERAHQAEQAIGAMLPHTQRIYHARVVDAVPMYCPAWMCESVHRMLLDYEYSDSSQRLALIDAVGTRTQDLVSQEYDSLLEQYQISHENRCSHEQRAKQFAIAALRKKWQTPIVQGAITAVSLYYRLLFEQQDSATGRLGAINDIVYDCVPLGEKQGEPNSLILYWPGLTHLTPSAVC